MTRENFLRGLTAALIAGMCAPALAQNQAGRVLLALGEVVAVRGTQQIPLSFGSTVQAGDTIRLGPSSNAQIRMSDESVISLRERSVLRLDQYSYSGRVDGTERSVFSLLAGGMRTITGIIGRLPNARDRYAVQTPVATIGIRGTHYTLVLCNNDCAPGTGSSGQRGAAANGLFGGVTDGRIGARNEAGERVFGANQYFHVIDRKTPAQELLAPPSFLYDRLAARSRTTGQRGGQAEQSAGGGINNESRSSDAPPPPVPTVFAVAEMRNSSGDLNLVPTTYSFFPQGTYSNLGLISVTADPSGELHGVDINAGTVTFDSTGFLHFDCGFGCFGNRGLATTADRGGVSGVVEWGRWVGGPVSAGGWLNNMSFGDYQGLHYIIGSYTDPMPITGTGSFALYGATMPTFNDNVGGGLGRGSVTSGAGSVDFLKGTVNADLALSFTGQAGKSDYALAMRGASLTGSTFNGSGSMTFSGGGLNVCGSSCFAQFAGGFAGSNATYMGLGYDVRTGSFIIDGVAVMKRQ